MILKQVIRYENAPALEATWVDENDAAIKCHAYSNHPEQMAMLRADLGADAAQYEGMIAEVEATYVPPEPVPEPADVPVADLLARAKDDLRALRKPMLDAVNGIGWRASMTGNITLANEAVALAEALLDITADSALNAATNYNDMRAAGVAAYKRIAATASPELAIVFREITGA